MIITSRSNKTAKLFSSLTHKKYREETGLFVVEGKRAVNDVIKAAPELIKEIITTPEAINEYPDATVFSKELLSSVCETVTTQGVAAILKRPDPQPAYGECALMLDGIRDPGNLGTLIRTACAAGYRDVYVKDCTDAYSGKVVRSTMSAIVKVNVIPANADTLNLLKERGYVLFGADMGGTSVFEYPAPDNKYCIIIGGEANGISDEVRNKCDNIISIPMTGEIESLNAAVSGAVLMYEFLRKKL